MHTAMSRREFLHCPLILFGFLLILPGILPSEIDIELLSTPAPSCVKAVKEAEQTYAKCMKAYQETEDYQEGLRSNLSTCPTCLLWCRKSDIINCMKKGISDNYHGFEVSKTIPQSFFTDLMESFVNMTCQNEAEGVKDILSWDVTTKDDVKCMEKLSNCDDTALFSFASVKGDTRRTKGFEFTERTFCRVIEHTFSCFAGAFEECFEKAARGFNRLYNHTITSTSCAEYQREGLTEDFN